MCHCTQIRDSWHCTQLQHNASLHLHTTINPSLHTTINPSLHTEIQFLCLQIGWDRGLNNALEFISHWLLYRGKKISHFVAESRNNLQDKNCFYIYIYIYRTGYKLEVYQNIYKADFINICICFAFNIQIIYLEGLSFKY